MVILFAAFLTLAHDSTSLSLPPLSFSSYMLSHFPLMFRQLAPYQQALQHRVCSLLITSLRSTAEVGAHHRGYSGK